MRTETNRGGTAFVRADLFGLGLLAVGSLCIGLLVNKLRLQPLPLVYAPPKDRLGEIVTRMSAQSSASGQPTPDRAPWQRIGLDEFQALVSAHRGASIDARPQALYQTGHVPGALDLPREDFEGGYARVRASLASEKDQPIVIYCSEADCQDSELVADALSHLGYRRLFVYKEGWEEWMRAGLPQETTHSP